MLHCSLKVKSSSLLSYRKSISGCGSLNPSHYSSVLLSLPSLVNIFVTFYVLINLLLFPSCLCCFCPRSLASMGTEVIHAQHDFWLRVTLTYSLSSPYSLQISVISVTLIKLLTNNLDRIIQQKYKDKPTYQIST